MNVQIPCTQTDSENEREKRQIQENHSVSTCHYK